MKLNKRTTITRLGGTCVLLAALTQSLFSQAETEFGKFTGDFRARAESADQQGRPASETGGVDFGHEIDLVITIPVDDRWKMIVKAATLDAAGGIPDNDKFWFEADFSF